MGGGLAHTLRSIPGVGPCVCFACGFLPDPVAPDPVVLSLSEKPRSGQSTLSIKPLHRETRDISICSHTQSYRCLLAHFSIRQLR